MKLEVNSSRSFEDVQKAFNERYPYLKLEFFTRAHEKGKPSAGKHMVSPKRKIAEYLNGRDGVIEIRPQMSVFELEKAFEDVYGLHVQVFRKSGRIWLETTATDDWTLKTQNDEGRELSEGHNEKGELPDYQEQD